MRTSGIKPTKDVGFCESFYHFATPKLAALAQREAIYKDQKFSDHAPLTIDYGFKL